MELVERVVILALGGPVSQFDTLTLNTVAFRCNVWKV